MQIHIAADTYCCRYRGGYRIKLPDAIFIFIFIYLFFSLSDAIYLGEYGYLLGVFFVLKEFIKGVNMR